MKRSRSYRAFVVTLLVLVATAAQTSFSQFKEPWKDPNKALVLDGKHDNEINWGEIQKDRRIAGMIFRATGPDSGNKLTEDPKYQELKAEAKRRGYLWGSFHVGMAGKFKSPEDQAKFYLDKAKPTEDEVIALDLEDFSKSQYMNADEAVIFVNYIKKETGRYPIVYVTGYNRDVIVKRFRNNKDNVFAKMPLWYVRIKRDITKLFPVKPDWWWSTYTLWQFASELNCCWKTKPRCRQTPPATCPFEKRPPAKRVPRVCGVAYDMDINIYNGTVEELRSKWPFTFTEK